MTDFVNNFILLVNGQSKLRVDFGNVYFAFGSGRLAYDCVTCNAQCCRGHDYLVQIGHELQSQLATRPELSIFVESRDQESPGEGYKIRNFPPGCFFLSDCGLCSVHQRSGYAAKPETCRLFPFNDFLYLGGILVVRPHKQLCPLMIVPEGQTNRQSEYNHLLEEMSLKPITAAVPEVGMPFPRAGHIVELERRIVALSEEHAPYARYSEFVTAQMVVQKRGSLQGASQDGVTQSSANQVRSFASSLSAMLGIPPAALDPPDSELLRAMIAMTPFVRSQVVLQRGMETALRSAVSLDRVPFYVQSLYAVAALARASGMLQVTFRTIAKLAQVFEPVIELLAYADCKMVWRPDHLIALTVHSDKQFQRPFLRIAKALLPAVQRKAAVSLAEVVGEHNRFEGLERMLFLKLLAKHFRGRLEPLDPEVQGKQWFSHWRTNLQKWALENIGEDVLDAACERDRRRGKGPDSTVPVSASV